MKVRVREMGFWNGHRVRPGAVIDVPEGRKVPAWCAPLDAVQAPAARRGRPRKEPATLSQIDEVRASFIDVMQESDDA